MLSGNKNGFIKINRDIQNWEWYGEPSMVVLWFHLLLNANWDDREWRGEPVLRGQLITSLSTLSEKTGLSIKQIRTCLSRLEKGKEIGIKTARKWTKITICEYDSYVGCETSEGQTKGTMEGTQRAHEGHTNEEDKNIRNIEKKNIKEKEMFSADVEAVYAAYPTKCPYSSRTTSKGSRDKVTIRSLLKTKEWNADSIIAETKCYLKECAATKTFLKNYSTFLHRLASEGPGVYTNLELMMNPSNDAKEKARRNEDGSKTYNGFTFYG